MDEIRILAPTAILGYGFPEESFHRGMEKEPHVIAVDAGSVDPGPYYLGAGVSFTDRRAVKRDLTIMLRAIKDRDIPLIIGSAGGSGSWSHLEWNLEIIKEIAEEEGMNFPLAMIEGDISKTTVIQGLTEGKITALGPTNPLTREEIESSTNIVAQMGIEPFIAALSMGAKVILAGRAYDPAPFAAYPVLKGFPKGLAMHLGKILECASIAAIPGSGSDCMMGYLHQDYFEVEPLNKDRKATVTSVAAHTLYEKTDPYILPGPGGVINLKNTQFELKDNNRVRVKGSIYEVAEKYTIKIEGAKPYGFRTISIAGVRDEVFIKNIKLILQGVRERVKDNFQDISPEEYFLRFNIYGKDGVMGQLEPIQAITSHEVGIIIEVIAKSQDLADTICSFTRSTLLHYGYPGRVSTAGNLALPYSPSDFKGGQIYVFNLHHLMEIDDPLTLFPIELMQI